MRMLAPAVIAWIACLIAVGLQSAFVVWISCMALAGLLTVWCVITRRGGAAALIAVSLAAAAFVSLSAAVVDESRRPEALVNAAEGERSVLVVASVDGFQQSTEGGPSQVRVVSTLTMIDGTSVHLPATVFGQVDGEQLAIGSTIDVRATLVLTAPSDASAALVFADEPLTITDPPPWFLAWAHDMRRAFVELCAELPGPGGSLLPGLAVGDTRAVGPELDSAMKTSSLSHLTAVSGANCAIIVACVILLLARLGAGRITRVIVALAVLGAFVILVTPQSSVVRASIMASLALLVHLTGRPSGGVPVLSGSVILMLLIDPWYAYDAGFALSVLATGGLLLLTRPLAATLGKVLPKGLSMVIAVPLAAQLACQPVLILLSSTISIYGVAANILAAPAAPIGTVVGLVACLITQVLPAVAMPLAWIAFVPSSWIAGVAMAISGLPAAALPWIPGPFGALTLAVVTTLACGVALSPRWRARWTGKAVIGGLCICLGVYGGVIAMPAVSSSLQRPRDWIVAACDVGQGDAVLLRSNGGVILVDTGPDPELVADCLDTLHIESIDLLVLTHYDADHAGGLAGIIERTESAFVQAPHDEAGERTVTALHQAGVPVDIVTAGRTGSVGGIDYTVLWPESRELTGNAGSLVIDARIGSTRIVMLGDLGEDSQRRVLSHMSRRATADIVKVAHHGSADQLPELYDRLAATLAIISVGADNTYGHPADETLDELVNAGSRVLRTDRRGVILITLRDGEFMVWSQKTAVDGGGG